MPKPSHNEAPLPETLTIALVQQHFLPLPRGTLLRYELAGAIPRSFSLGGDRGRKLWWSCDWKLWAEKRAPKLDTLQRYARAEAGRAR